MSLKRGCELGLMITILAVLLLGYARANGQTTSASIRGADVLATHFAAMKNISTLQANFDCEKRMKMLDTPLISSGTVQIAKTKGRASVRFTTNKPYTSEVILHGQEIWMKSQHETKWTKADQSGRPGLAAIMGQLADWSVGEAGRISDMYDVTSVSDEVPARPESKVVKGAAANDIFVLSPRDKTIAKSIKRIQLAFDQKTHELRYVEILSTEEDATHYWFYDVELDAKLLKDTFAPAGVK